MIKRKGDYQKEKREKMRGGEGTVTIEKLWEPGIELKANNRLFAKLIIPPGAGIGFHAHEKEEEVYFVLSGKGETETEGKKIEINPGDSTLTGNGAGHSVKNTGQEDLEILAVITTCQ